MVLKADGGKYEIQASTHADEEAAETFLCVHSGKPDWNLVRWLTDDLRNRIRQHKDGVFDGFTKKYKVNRLMYFQIFHESATAEAREKQMKKCRREKKVALFAESNSRWKDLSEEILDRSIRDILM